MESERENIDQMQNKVGEIKNKKKESRQESKKLQGTSFSYDPYIWVSNKSGPARVVIFSLFILLLPSADNREWYTTEEGSIHRSS